MFHEWIERLWHYKNNGASRRVIIMNNHALKCKSGRSLHLYVNRIKAIISNGIAELDMNQLDAFKIAATVETTATKILSQINKKKNVIKTLN